MTTLLLAFRIVVGTIVLKLVSSHQCNTIAVRADESYDGSGIRYDNLPQKDFIALYGLSSSESFDERPVYFSADGAYTLLYDASDTTWHIRNVATGISLMYIYDAEQTPYSSPEMEYGCFIREGRDYVPRVW